MTIPSTAPTPVVSLTQGVQKLPPPRLEVTHEVRREIDKLLKGNGAFVRASVERRDKDFDLMIRIFEDEGVPADLLNLAMIESGFRADARSYAGAVGMWQLMKPTARNYGLKVEPARDQRRDIIRSTLAAAQHLKDLFHEHQDWYLALAAYNAGSGAVTRALLRTGSSNFWDIVRAGKLPRQTAQFVPKFIAATILAKVMDRYGSENLARSVAALLEPARRLKPGEMFAFNLEDGSGSAISGWTGPGSTSAG